MKTEFEGVDWYLDCDPRLAQLEALARSYTGFQYRDHKDDTPNKRPLGHAGKPIDGWGHFLEMRVGKTPTALNEFMQFKADFGINKFFMLAPNKYKYTWGLEWERFGVDVPVHVFESQNRHKFAQFMKDNPEGGVIVNYETLRYKDNVDLFEQFIDDRTYMGADESVMIKNPESGFSETARELGKMAAVTRPLTGKPTPQGVQDLYAQLRFAKKLEGWNFYQFRNKFALKGGFKGKQIIGVKNEDKLNRLREASSFFARRIHWGRYVASDYEVMELDLLPEQLRVYREMETEFVADLENGTIVTADQVITKYVKLQQIAAGFIRDEEKQVHQIVPFTKTPKFVDVLDRINNYINGKVIIFYHYAPTGDNLAKALANYNPAQIKGSAGMKKLGTTPDAEKHRFNNDPKCRIMLGQMKAIKYGHTLMGTPDDPCLTSIYYENSYSLDDRAQTEERNQGEGQLDAIHIVDYCCSNIEKRIIQNLVAKEEVASVIMGYYKGV